MRFYEYFHSKRNPRSRWKCLNRFAVTGHMDKLEFSSAEYRARLDWKDVGKTLLFLKIKVLPEVQIIFQIIQA